MRAMHLRWDDMQTVEALVRTGSVLGAARALGLQHSSVSRRVDALERALALPLFVRGPRLTPTALARSIAAPAAVMAEEARHIEILLQGEQRSREQRLVVTTNDALSPMLFAAVARSDLPQRVLVRVSDEEVELAPGITDLALRPGARPRAALRGWNLGRLKIGLYRARSSRPDGLWVQPSASLRSKASMRWWKAVPEDGEARVECDTLLSMRDACVSGLGRTVLPAALAVDDPRLVLEEDLGAGPPVWLLASATRRSDKGLREVAERLVRSLRGVGGAWEG